MHAHVVPVITKVKILQRNRLDIRTVFFSVKLWKQTKNCTSVFEDPRTNLGTDVLFMDGRKPEAQE